MLERILYISTIADGVIKQDVRRIVDAAAISNRRLDITGLLVHSELHFAQMLEGRSDALDAVMARITRDTRHKQLHVVRREPITIRLFEHWRMGMLDGEALALDLARLYRDEADPDDIVRRVLAQAERDKL